MEQLALLLIPFGNGASVIPKNLVEYILPYAPLLPVSYEHPLLVGSLLYKNGKVPVIDFIKIQESTQAMPAINIGEQSQRLVIVTSVSEESKYDSYAVVASSPPRIVEVNREIIQEVNSDIADLFYCKVKFSSGSIQQFAYVPDLMKLERTLFSGKQRL